MASPTTHNLTIPTTVGALLTEEWTIDPLSHLPSFLELTFVDVARNSGRRALSAAWGVGIAWLEGVMERLRQLERIVDRRASRLAGGGSSSSRDLSGAIRLLKIIRAFTIQIARLRVKLLRRICHIFLGTVKSLGPELQTLIMFAIDYNCMHHLAGATACEMVYGLKRSKIVRQQQHANINLKSEDTLQQQRSYQNKVAELTKFDKTLSALLAALLPYCKERCDRLYNEWKEGQSNNNSVSYHTPINIMNNNNIRTNQNNTYNETKQNFIKIYPYFHMAHEGSIFLYQFAYLLGYTPYWSFSLHALGVMLRRMTVADVRQQQQQKQLKQQQNGATSTLPKSMQRLPQHTNDVAKTVPLQTKLTIPRLLRGAVLFSISYTLLSGWYSHFKRELRLRRRRWIAGNEDESTSQQTRDNGNEDDSQRRPKLPIPPPPMPPTLINVGEESNVNRWSCPICKEPRINPTASTSGYVYCYKCLVSHLRNNGEYCPMTGMPCWENRVVRLFEPTATRRGAA